jgi:hypothetical protein
MVALPGHIRWSIQWYIIRQLLGDERAELQQWWKP